MKSRTAMVTEETTWRQPTDKTRAWLEVDIVCCIRTLFTSPRPALCLVACLFQKEASNVDAYQAAEKCVYTF